ncbi:PBSX family phage terminase large subunit [Paenibacillus xylanilyticus]|uniref:PBSX family phage terminase large subunit n=1 Tax=Paenibacillus xylanilyticus TaxID=248903 RepID=A0A7Y6BSW4_9BACL|nr:PBSX family phage terminase large subunit [Paenibacillus xylanilyticus]NUU74013.1 PBSX family phage terminase large subunit [Paenibacillus xylanilyticus]
MATLKLKPSPFKWKPFSDKQVQVLTWWMPESPHHDMDAIICDGSVRAGKTVAMSFSYIVWATETFRSEQFGMAGKTIGALRRNVVGPLKRMLASRGYQVHDNKTDNVLTVSRGLVSNQFFLFGGKDERSQDLIQGITLAGMFFDEVALMPKSFVDQATARCSIEAAKIWFNCNPAGPYHWFKVEWLDNLAGKRAIHLHFMMEDNLSLSEKVRDRYRRMYTGIFYQRFILGLWVMAEGVIFSKFNDAIHKKPREWFPAQFDRKFICIDYGANNPTTFLKYGVQGNVYYELDEYYHDIKKLGERTNSEYADELQAFVDGDEYAIFIDPSAKAFIIELQQRGINHIQAAVNDVLDGIQTVSNRFQHDELYICADNTNSLKELVSYIWDEKAAQRGEDKPIKQNDHTCDARRYGIHTDYLIQQSKARKEERRKRHDEGVGWI